MFICIQNQRVFFFFFKRALTYGISFWCNSLSSDQNINQFLVLVKIEPQISYATIRDFTSWANWNPQIKRCLQFTTIYHKNISIHCRNAAAHEAAKYTIQSCNSFYFSFHADKISQSLWHLFVWEMSKLWLFPFNEI